MIEETGKLIGLADPSGMSLGFLVPLFAGRTSNAPLVQNISPDATIDGFEPYEAPGASLMPATELTANVGDPAVFAFGFGRGDVVTIVGGGTGRDDLRARLDEPVLRSRPMLAMEVAEFLGLQDLKWSLASEAHKLMRKTSIETADTWRDLSLLTPEVRRTLTRNGWRGSGSSAKTTVAQIRHDVVELLGTGQGLSHAQLAGLRAAALEATSTLASLYPPPKQGWRVRVHGTASRGSRQEADAAVLLASARALDLARHTPWPPVPDLDIHAEIGKAFARVVDDTETPLFVVYDADDSDVMRSSTGDRAMRQVHGIALDPGRRHFDRHAQPEAWSSTHVPTAGIGGGGRSQIAGIRLAVAAELDRRAHRTAFSDRSTVLLRARGIGPDPEADAWAALYDRAWAMRLAPWRALLILDRKASTDLGRLTTRDHVRLHAPDPGPNWAAQALFHEPTLMQGRLTTQVMADLRNTAALLVPHEQRREADLDRHRLSIARLLSAQGWHVDDDVRDPHAALIAEGANGPLRVMADPDGSGPPDWNQTALFEIDLQAIDRILVSGPASPSEVLRRLTGSGELVVGMRDLTSQDAATATPLTIMAAQLRRQVTRFPSRAGTHLIALVAFQAQRVGPLGDAALVRSLTRKKLGREVHLLISSTRMVEGALVAKIKVVDGVGARGMRWREIGSFRMRVAPDEVSIADVTSIASGRDDA